MPPPIAWPSAERQAHFERWLAGIAGQHGLDPATLSLASADASFRRYLRVRGSQGNLIVMDAPPPLEDVRPFVHVAGLIARAGLHAPRVLQADAAQGFLLLTDLGDQQYLQALQAADEAQADRLMRQALTSLVRWQQGVAADTLPVERGAADRLDERGGIAHARPAGPARHRGTQRLDAAEPDGVR